MMQAVRRILPVFLLAAAACFAQDVRYNFAAGEDFSKFKTFKWADCKGAQQLNQLADQQLKAAVDAELAKKGLTKTEGDDADLYICYQVALGQEQQLTSYNTGWGYGPGWGSGWYGGGGGGMTTTTTSTIHKGQIDLDIYEAAAKQLIWRGTATKTIDPKAKPEKRQKNLQKGVAKLLKNFPPPPKKS
ncbi:MAG TPA: DUF4136 domain-containing protein [Bryobacteraceae bacterium]|jgi:hypothetical protein|nr:DUF4136 domain-containing protein [Bryobacteraceae bacterium]